MAINPTICLAIGLGMSFSGVLLAAVLVPTSGHWPLWMGFGAAQVLIIIATFTVAHDAVHRVASRNRFINAAMLWGCGVIFLFDPMLFRRIHLWHHAHTHRPLDPDRFAAANQLLKRVVRSAFLIVGYYTWAVRNLWNDRRWRAHVAAAPLIPLGVGLLFAAMGKMNVFLFVWLIPLLLADAALAFFISSLPHDHENDVTTDLKLPRVLCWLLGNGHLHGTHHARPRVPWYRLPQVARESCPSIRQRHR